MATIAWILAEWFVASCLLVCAWVAVCVFAGRKQRRDVKLARRTGDNLFTARTEGTKS